MRTAEEKHALIEKALFGVNWTKPEPLEIFERFGWEKDGQNSGAAWDCRQSPPPYSTDLNACATAEAKVAELGKQETYMEFLADIIDIDKEKNIKIAVFNLATASASQRVDAMCALIDAGVLEKNVS